MADIKLAGSGINWKGDANGSGQVILYGADGLPLTSQHNDPLSGSDHGLPMMGVNDDNFRFQRMDRLGSAAIALNNQLFSEYFEGATVSSPNRLTVSTTTFTQAQTPAGGLNLNNGAVTTAGAAALVVSNRTFPKFQRAPLQSKWRGRLGHVTNAVMETGFGAPANQTSSPTVGAYWQVTAAGVIQGVLTFNGVDQTTAPVALSGGWQNNFYTLDVIMDDDEVVFYMQGTASGLILAERRIKMSLTQTRLLNATHLPVFSRLHFPTAPATAATMILASHDVVMLDVAMNKPWGQTAAHNGQGASTHPTTFAQAAQFANSAAPASATLSNTAAGYTTLGGLFQFAAVAGAATDYALFGFTVPSPYSFVCTGISIDAWNTGAAVATTPTLLNWFASEDQTAISLATANNRRTFLGGQSFAVGAAIGARADRAISEDFSSAPLITNPNRIFVIGLRMPVGSATASQIIAGGVTIKGFFE